MNPLLCPLLAAPFWVSKRDLNAFFLNLAVAFSDIQHGQYPSFFAGQVAFGSWPQCVCCPCNSQGALRMAHTASFRHSFSSPSSSFFGNGRPVFLALLMVSVMLPTSAQLTAEEQRLFNEIAQCFFTKNVDLAGLDRVVSARATTSKLKDSLVAELPEAARDSATVHPPLVYKQAGMDAGKALLAADLRYGTVDPHVLEAIRTGRVFPDVRDVLGKSLPAPFTEEQKLAAKFLAERQRDMVDAAKLAQAKQQVETLRKRLAESIREKATAGTPLSAKQAQFLRGERLKAVGRQLKLGASVSAGMSAVVHIRTLFAGEVLQYFGAVGKDTGIAVLAQGLGLGMEEIGLDKLAPGASVVIFGIIDAVKASRTGDWSRFGLNAALNTGTTVAGVAGMKGGAAAGTLLWPGVGTVVGGFFGGVLSAMAARTALGATPLGKMTSAEQRKAVADIAAKLNVQLREVGLELDTSVGFEEMTRLMKDGRLPTKITDELAAAQARAASGSGVALGGVFEEKGTMDSLLGIASYVSPSARVEGLRALKVALGC